MEKMGEGEQASGAEEGNPRGAQAVGAPPSPRLLPSVSPSGAGGVRVPETGPLKPARRGGSEPTGGWAQTLGSGEWQAAEGGSAGVGVGRRDEAGKGRGAALWEQWEGAPGIGIRSRWAPSTPVCPGPTLSLHPCWGCGRHGQGCYGDGQQVSAEPTESGGGGVDAWGGACRPSPGASTGHPRRDPPSPTRPQGALTATSARSLGQLS